MAKLTLDQVMKESLWIAKVGGCRIVDTYDNVKGYYDDPDCRDIDLACKQPDHLQKFFDDYYNYCCKNGWMIIPDYYNNVYLKEVDHES